jgi:hypothetical protein
MPIIGAGLTGAMERHNDEVFGILLHDPHIKNVILNANWTGYLEGQRYFGHHIGREPAYSIRGIPVTRANDYSMFETQLRETVTELSAAGKTVFICTPNPTYPFNVMKGVTEMEKTGRDPNLGLTYGIDDFLAVNGRLLEIFDRLAISIPHTYVIPIHQAFFVNGRSVVAMNGHSLYSDGNHINEAGSELIGDRIAAFVKSKEQ